MSDIEGALQALAEAGCEVFFEESGNGDIVGSINIYHYGSEGQQLDKEQITSELARVLQWVREDNAKEDGG